MLVGKNVGSEITCCKLWKSNHQSNKILRHTKCLVLTIPLSYQLQCPTWSSTHDTECGQIFIVRKKSRYPCQPYTLILNYRTSRTQRGKALFLTFSLIPRASGRYSVQAAACALESEVAAMDLSFESLFVFDISMLFFFLLQSMPKIW